jgi:hypothetical protein
LLLDTNYYKASLPNPGKKQHQFEAKWFKEEGFCDIVEEKWNSTADHVPVLDRLKSMHDGLHAWDHTVLREPRNRLRKAQHDLEALMRGPINPEEDQKKFELARLIENL